MTTLSTPPTTLTPDPNFSKKLKKINSKQIKKNTMNGNNNNKTPSGKKKLIHFNNNIVDTTPIDMNGNNNNKSDKQEGQTNIINYLNKNGIQWYPIELEIKKRKDGKYDKKPKYNKFVKQMPKQTDFIDLTEEQIKKRQTYIEYFDYIAINTNKTPQVDVDFLDNKINNYDEQTLGFNDVIKQGFPYYKSATKKHGIHAFFKTDYNFNNKREQTQYEDIELLTGQWAWCKKDVIVYNADATDIVLNEDMIKQIINKNEEEEEQTQEQTPPPQNTTARPSYKDANLQELTEMADIIKTEYIDDYNEYVRIIWGLKNTDESLKDIAQHISTKSKHYDPATFEAWFNKLWNKSKGGVNAGTIYYYAKKSNLSEYNNIRLKSINNKDDQWISADDTLAELFLKGNDGDYIYKQSEKTIYSYNNGRWHEDNKCERMGYKVSKDLQILFRQKIILLRKEETKLQEQILKESQKDEKDEATITMLETKIKKLGEKVKFFNKLINNILSSNKTSNITTKIKQHLSVRDFENITFDNNPYIFCFKNYVYDLKTHNKISSTREDYILTYLDYDYEPLEEDKFKTLDKLIDTIFPDKEIKDNYLHYMATCLYGETIEKFIIANGSGGNGKGVINELLMKMLNNYGYTGNNSVLLQPMKDGGNPAIANMNKKRCVIFREPEAEKSKLNISVIKELTGGEEINARQLFKNQTKTEINATFFMECNAKPKIDGKLDEACGRRLCDIPFKSTFTTKSELYNNKDLTNCFKADKYFKTTEFKNEYKMTLWHYLIRFIKKYEEKHKCSITDNFEDCSEVRERTAKYIMKCDEKYEWFNTIWEKSENKNDFLRVKEVYYLFKESDLWANMSKKERRDMTEKDFKEYLSSNINFKLFYKDRVKYKDEAGTRKDARNVIIYFKKKTIDPEEEGSDSETEYEEI